MARAGMAVHCRGGSSHGNVETGDDVQRSIELLDRVLSEFDDVENANQMQNISAHVNPSCNEPGHVSSTPDDESPSLGHQSEDDGYMSMNGRKAKFSLAFKPLTEVPPHQENSMPPGDPNDFPPPPEEAERLISTLLPKVSPVKKINKSVKAFPISQILPMGDTIPPPQLFQNCKISSSDSSTSSSESKHIATQTTLPKTRHQRPFGWEKANYSSRKCKSPQIGCRYGSLPFPNVVYAVPSPTRVPPRTVPTAIERHREVRRRGSEENLSSDLEETVLRPLNEFADDERFSDDSLEDTLPPPPNYTNKRSSIAWEVPLDDESLMTPGSTKEVGRRRRKSGSHSSTSSIPSRLKELDDWPDPPPYSTEEELVSGSPFSDSDERIILPPELNNLNLSGNSTYIVRRDKKDRTSLTNLNSILNSNSSLNSRLSSDLSIPASRFSIDLNARLSRELNTPNSRYSIDLSTPHSRLSSPKSRLSLDLNNSRPLSQEYNSSSSRVSVEHINSRPSTPLSKLNNDFKKHSSTFDNIKSFIKESTVETCPEISQEKASEFMSPTTPVVRVVSLPSLSAEESVPKRELDVTVEEEEDVDSPNKSSAEVSPLRKIERNISELLERRDIQASSIVQDDKCIVQLNGVLSDKKYGDSFKHNNDNHANYNEEYYRKLLIDSGNVQYYPKRSIQKSESAKEMLIAHKDKILHPLKNSSSIDFPSRTDSFQHEFPPLPPSPVEEDDDEYSEIVQPFKHKQKSETLPSSSEPPTVPPHKDQSSSSLKTRSMDAGFNRGRRNYSSSTSNRNFLPERRTLPNEIQGTKKKTYQKRSSHSPQEEHHLQTSCSLPETPIFARGCDIPRTPHRKAPEVPPHTGRLIPRQSSTMGSLSTIGNMSTGGYRRNSGLEQAIVGAELLRLAGGPGRGWYPKHRSNRPASIENLDRLTPGQSPWESNRKPLTLPPNLTPKFFQRSPRDALRRVTSLLIKKGNTGKETKKEKDLTNMKLHEAANGDEGQKKKGFFRNFWKKSRHYSLEENR